MWEHKALIAIFKFKGARPPRRPRQGLTRHARKATGGRCRAARRRREEPPQPAGSPPGSRGLARKARLPPNIFNSMGKLSAFSRPFSTFAAWLAFKIWRSISVEPYCSKD